MGKNHFNLKNYSDYIFENSLALDQNETWLRGDGTGLCGRGKVSLVYQYIMETVLTKLMMDWV